MTRKATAKKNAAKPKSLTAYVVVRRVASENECYTEPDRVFVDKAAARRHADELNRELRAFTNPFQDNWPDSLMKGGEKAFAALLKKLKLTPPTKKKDEYAADWGAWWDRAYFNITDAQRDAIWNALDKYDWYKVKETELE